VPTKITLYSSPCFTSFGAAQNYPCQNKDCFVNLTVGARQNGEPDDRQCRYRKIGRANGTYSQIGGKHDGFKPSCLGPARRKNCGHCSARDAQPNSGKRDALRSRSRNSQFFIF